MLKIDNYRMELIVDQEAFRTPSVFLILERTVTPVEILAGFVNLTNLQITEWFVSVPNERPQT